MASWPLPDLASIKAEHRPRYLANCLAVRLWAKGESEENIGKAVLKASSDVEVYVGFCRRLVSRCLKTDSKGKIHGFHACLPGFKSEEKKGVRAPSNYLGKCFEKHPKIKLEMLAFLKARKTSKMVEVARLTPAIVHETFLGLCKDEGLDARAEWPFALTADSGVEAVRRWYHANKMNWPINAAINIAGDSAGGEVKQDYEGLDVERLDQGPKFLFERVEMDQHLVHELKATFVEAEDGTPEAVHVQRLWGVQLVDRSFDLVLAGLISFEPKYTRRDLYRCLYQVVYPPPRISKQRLMSHHCNYDEGARFAGEVPELAGLSFLTLAVDRDSIQTSDETIEQVQTLFGAQIEYGKPGRARTRQGVENRFKRSSYIAEFTGSATGSNTASPARRFPAKVTLELHNQATLAAEVWDLELRNHNVKPNAKCGGLSPIAAALRAVAAGHVFHSPMGAVSLSNLYQLLPRDKASLQRSRNSEVGHIGVYYMYGWYTSAELNEAQDLMFAETKMVTIYVQEDARHAVIVPHAFPLRVFHVALAGPYAANAHTVEWRAASERFIREEAGKAKGKAHLLGYGMNRTLYEMRKSKPGFSASFATNINLEDRSRNGDVHHIGMDAETAARKLKYSANLIGNDVHVEDADIQHPGAGDLFEPE